MKSLLCIFFLSCCIVLRAVDPANIVIFTSHTALGVAENFLAAAALTSQKVTGASYANLTSQKDGTLDVTNITITSFSVLKPSYSYSANASNASLVVVNSTTFSVTLGFLFVNRGDAVASGQGTATITATNSTYSTFLGSKDAKPVHAVTEFNITWGTFSVQTSYSPLPNNSVNVNISSALNANLTAPLNNSLIQGMLMAVNLNYAQSDAAWTVDVEYDFTLRRQFNWDNTYTLLSLDPTDLGTLATSEGSIEVIGYDKKADPATAVINRAGKPHQLAYSLIGFTNFIQYAFDQKYFEWTFDRDTFPLPNFDYSINDLSNIVPNLTTSIPVNSFVEVTCRPASSPALTTTFDATANVVSVGVKVGCGINVIDSAAILFNVTFDATVGIAPSIESTGTLNFVVASGSYVADSVSIVKQTLSGPQKTILEFYIKGALASLPGTYCQFGSGIELPTTSVSNADYKFDASWLYISYY